MGDEIKSSIFAFASVPASLSYCYFIAARIPKGFLRLIFLLPVYYHFTILPLYMPIIFFRGVSTLFITWLGNFKLLLFAFGRGPLSSDQSMPLHIFIASCALPIRTKLPNVNPSSTSSRPSKKKPWFLNLGTEILALFSLFGLAAKYEETVHPVVVQIAYSCAMFFLIEVLVTLSSSAVRALVGLELEAPSDEPYLSASLQDFWGKRWNLSVTNALRHTIYKPVRSISAVVLGNRSAALPAIFATFLVSGLMHELIYYYLSGVKPSWEVTWFFVLHGICVVIEMVLKTALGGKWAVPRLIAAPLTLGFVISTGMWLFFPPLTEMGIDKMVFEEFSCAGEYVKGRLVALCPTILGHKSRS
ncbi:acyl-CoA--sterol O-acyltransferase 1-like [Coffea eugenioides]|uniref:Acyl-CoA--sterol O-acyltransferase 1-like n=1 Tax=Coffea arabica TaxID=13443 RepID=A0A6P6S5Z6_COFAR|nr:acyl-CoA--sterol O-acyltransferase 1-like [Coffea arabica]XP_027170000.1 acyl-CoA--sterol O-acyltransferase 1-like [Coffea eugenioides]